MIWFEFGLCATLLTVFAYNLCKEGIIVSEKTHLEEGVIGMFFLAIATSFPEIVTSATAVFSLDRIALGYGDIIGSIMVNLMILFLLDVFLGKGRVLAKISKLNFITCLFVLIAAFFVLAGIFLRINFSGLFRIKHIGIESLLLIGIYFVYLKKLKDSGVAHSHEEVYKVPEESLVKIWAKFGALLIVVMLLGVWLAHVGEKMAVQTNLSQSFVGTLFLGFSTSLPEIIVSFVALRAGSIDMAVGNIFGSNLFDICVLSLLDFLSARPLLGSLTRSEIFPTVVIFILSLIAVLGMARKKDSLTRVNWDTGSIFAIGLVSFVILYFLR